ncbi:MAG: hypothetical protein IJX81_00570 [Clostridia bacterium]|nr:hypothetical protein [Clostridia bacterium]
MRNKGEMKARLLAKKCLTYIRLQGDVYAIEAAMVDNRPEAAPMEEEGKGVLKKLWNMISREVKNEVRKSAVQELTGDRQAALSALSEFESGLSAKELAFAKEPLRLKKFLEKKLFKKDEYGVKRVGFALAFMIEDGGEYRFAEESLQVVSELLFDDPNKMEGLGGALYRNYAALGGENAGEDGAVYQSVVAPVWLVETVELLSTLVGEKERSLKKLSGGELSTLLAARLTVLSELSGKMPEEKFKTVVDEYLRYVGDLRADAEYRWFVERTDAALSQAKIRLCDLCLNRLGKILGV